MKKHAQVLLPLMLAAALCSTISGAQEIYKSVDAQGQVSYGSAPVTSATEVQEVELRPGPTPEEVREAKQAGARISASANQMESQRVAREMTRNAEQAKQDAKQEVEQQQQAVTEQAQQNETMKEYYGYRDYTFPTPKVPGAGARVVTPHVRR